MEATTMTTIGVEDPIVEASILSNLASQQQQQQQVDFVRPNKLRKIICRQVVGTSWTQFQTCLERLVKNGRVIMESRNNNGNYEKVIILEKKGGESQQQNNNTVHTSPLSPTASSSSLSSPPNDLSSLLLLTKTKNVSIPRAIALYLVQRRGGRKKRNIEQTTKTQLTIHGIGPSIGLPLDNGRHGNGSNPDP